MVLSLGGGCSPSVPDGSPAASAGAGGEGGGSGGKGGGSGGVGGGSGGEGGGTGGVGGGTGGVGGGGSTQSPGTHFAATAREWSLPPDSPSPDGFFTFGYYDWTTMDLDGDGKPDLVVYTGASESNPHWLLYKNTGSGFAATPTEWSLPPDSPHPDGFFTLAYYDWTTMDLDGDGKPDLVVNTGASETNRRWLDYKNTGTGFAATATEWSLPADSPHPDGFFTFSYYDWTTMDLDGDGKPDLVVNAGASETNRRWLLYKNTGSGFAATATEWSLPADSPFPGGFFTFSYYDWTTMDLDGDGKPDLVVYTGASESNPHWLLYKNTGSGFAATATEWSLPPDSPSPNGFFTFSYYDWTTMDLDGDGKPDLVVYTGASESNPHWLFYKNTGSGFTATATEWTLPADSPHPDGFFTLAYYDWTTMDLDGDGKPDLVVNTGASETNRRWLLYKNTP
ncbi:glycine-rich protein [Vulgatibacter incomptus]|uniref:Glycine-rich protein n=1 Tax=Vulgatibacter incomptus TaxID=1391653 RepID=A0A0K1PCH7_9BACT|nr:glycine-rich protein [Vulgatibacter incomptus]